MTRKAHYESGADPLKILHVLKHGVRGNGNVHVAVDLAVTQAELGHQVVVACARGSYDDLLRSRGVRVEVIPEPVDVRSAARTAAAMWSILRRHRPDITHSHMMSTTVLSYPLVKVSRSILITTVHNSFDGHSKLMRLGSVVVAVSEAERQLLLSRGFTPRKVVTILNGADGSPRESLQGDEIGPLHRPAVMTLSGLHPRKAVGDVIDAFSRLAADHPTWHLNVVGWGPERDELEKRVSAHGLEGRVHFLGSTVNPRPLLEAAEVFATASLADPCPLTVTEARAAGCAIVGTTVGGIPELLDHGRAGRLVPPSDPVAFAEALRPLLDDPSELSRWQVRARTGAEFFSVQRMAADYLEVYRWALSAGTKTAGR